MARQHAVADGVYLSEGSAVPTVTPETADPFAYANAPDETGYVEPVAAAANLPVDPRQLDNVSFRNHYAPQIQQLNQQDAYNQRVAAAQTTENQKRIAAQQQQALKVSNDTAEADFIAKGIKHRKNEQGQIVPNLDEKGKPMFTEDTFPEQVDEQGNPFTHKRDQNGKVVRQDLVKYGQNANGDFVRLHAKTNEELGLADPVEILTKGNAKHAGTAASYLKKREEDQLRQEHLQSDTEARDAQENYRTSLAEFSALGGDLKFQNTKPGMKIPEDRMKELTTIPTTGTPEEIAHAKNVADSAVAYNASIDALSAAKRRKSSLGAEIAAFSPMTPINYASKYLKKYAQATDKTQPIRVSGSGDLPPPRQQPQLPPGEVGVSPGGEDDSLPTPGGEVGGQQTPPTPLAPTDALKAASDTLMQSKASLDQKQAAYAAQAAKINSTEMTAEEAANERYKLDAMREDIKQSVGTHNAIYEDAKTLAAAAQAENDAKVAAEKQTVEDTRAKIRAELKANPYTSDAADALDAVYADADARIAKLSDITDPDQRKAALEAIREDATNRQQEIVRPIIERPAKLDALMKAWDAPAQRERAAREAEDEANPEARKFKRERLRADEEFRRREEEYHSTDDLGKSIELTTTDALAKDFRNRKRNDRNEGIVSPEDRAAIAKEIGVPQDEADKLIDDYQKSTFSGPHSGTIASTLSNGRIVVNPAYIWDNAMAGKGISAEAKDDKAKDQAWADVQTVRSDPGIQKSMADMLKNSFPLAWDSYLTKHADKPLAQVIEGFRKQEDIDGDKWENFFSGKWGSLSLGIADRLLIGAGSGLEGIAQMTMGIGGMLGSSTMNQAGAELAQDAGFTHAMEGQNSLLSQQAKMGVEMLPLMLLNPGLAAAGRPLGVAAKTAQFAKVMRGAAPFEEALVKKGMEKTLAAALSRAAAAQDLVGMTKLAITASERAGMDLASKAAIFATAGAQSAGYVQLEASEAYRKQEVTRLLDGRDPSSVSSEEMDRIQRQATDFSVGKARPLAAMAGIVTGLLTTVFPKGNEALEKYAMGLPARSAVTPISEIVGKVGLKKFGEFLKSGTVKSGLANFLIHLGIAVTDEALEEGLDQAFQETLSSLTYAPEKKFGDILASAFDAAGSGGLMGLLGGSASGLHAYKNVRKTGGAESGYNRVNALITPLPPGGPSSGQVVLPEHMAAAQVAISKLPESMTRHQMATLAAIADGKIEALESRDLAVVGLKRNSSGEIVNDAGFKSGQLTPPIRMENGFPIISESAREAAIAKVPEMEQIIRPETDIQESLAKKAEEARIAEEAAKTTPPAATPPAATPPAATPPAATPPASTPPASTAPPASTPGSRKWVVTYRHGKAGGKVGKIEVDAPSRDEAAKAAADQLKKDGVKNHKIVPNDTNIVEITPPAAQAPSNTVPPHHTADFAQKTLASVRHPLLETLNEKGLVEIKAGKGSDAFLTSRSARGHIRIVVNPEMIADYVAKQGMTDEEAKFWIEKAADEETKHAVALLALTDVEITELGASLGKDFKNEIVTLYNAPLSDFRMGGEAIRIAMQLAENGTVTEAYRLVNAELRKANSPLLAALKKVLAELKNLISSLTRDDAKLLREKIVKIDAFIKGIESETTQEAPKAEAPKAEAPTTEAPTTEAPTTDAPKAEAPKAEAPPKKKKPATPSDPKLARLQKAVDDAQADFDAKQAALIKFMDDNFADMSGDSPEMNALVNAASAAKDVLDAAISARNAYTLNETSDQNGPATNTEPTKLAGDTPAAETKVPRKAAAKESKGKPVSPKKAVAPKAQETPKSKKSAPKLSQETDDLWDDALANEGLAASMSSGFDEKLPPEKQEAFNKLSVSLVKDGVDTPEALARVFEAKGPHLAKYTNRLWRMMTAFFDTDNLTPNWEETYASIRSEEEPKAEEPKAEEPKAEEPKAEEPKAEEPKAPRKKKQVQEKESKPTDMGHYLPGVRINGFLSNGRHKDRVSFSIEGEKYVFNETQEKFKKFLQNRLKTGISDGKFEAFEMFHRILNEVKRKPRKGGKTRPAVLENWKTDPVVAAILVHGGIKASELDEKGRPVNDGRPLYGGKMDQGLKAPAHNIIYKGRGRGGLDPDVMMEALIGDGLFNEGDKVDKLWDYLTKASHGQVEGTYESHMEQLEQQHKDFHEMLKPGQGKTEIRVSMLTPGAKVRLGEHVLVVGSVGTDGDGNVIRANFKPNYGVGEHSLFGDSTEPIFVDGFEPVETEMSEYERERQYSEQQEQEQDEAEQEAAYENAKILSEFADELEKTGEQPVETPKGKLAKVANKPFEKKERRAAGDQILTLVEPKEHSENLVPENLRDKMYKSQIDGANATLNTLERIGSALNGDGTGVGKSRQIIAVAEFYRAKGKNVFIITDNGAIGKPWQVNPNKPVLGGSLGSDSKAMGVKLELMPNRKRSGNAEKDDPGVAGSQKEGVIYVSTYARVESDEIPEGSVVIYDEAHNLANMHVAGDNSADEWGEKFREIAEKQEKAAFYTATPGDKPHQMSYMHSLLGFPTPKAFLDEAASKGLNKASLPKDPLKLEKLMTWLRSLFSTAADKGNYLQRSISYEGTDVQMHDVHGTKEGDPWAKLFLNKMDELGQYEVTHKLKAREAYELYAAELTKIGEAVKLARQELKAGRKVAIYVSRVNAMEIWGMEKLPGDDGETVFGPEEKLGEIVSPLDLLRKELLIEGITFTELHNNSSDSSQQAQDAFNGGTDVIIASLESGGTGINLDDTKGDRPRTAIFLFAPYRGVSTIQAMGRFWRSSTIQNDNNPTRFVFLVASDIPRDAKRSAVLAKKLQLMDATLGGSAIDMLPMSNAKFDPRDIAGTYMTIYNEDADEEVADFDNEPLAGVAMKWRKVAGGYAAEVTPEFIEWQKKGGQARTGLSFTLKAKRTIGDKPGVMQVLALEPFTVDQMSAPGASEGLAASMSAFDDGQNTSHIDYDRLKELGTTNNWFETGYISPDGTQIDLSGKREGGQPGTRSYDHREVGGSAGMTELKAQGFIRVSPSKGSHGSINLSRPPTYDQARALRTFIALHKGDVVVEVEDGLGEWSDSMHSYFDPERTGNFEYDGENTARIIGDIRRFFNGQEVTNHKLHAPYEGLAASMSAGIDHARHAELEKKHNAGTITPEETAEAQKLVDAAAKAAGFTELVWQSTSTGKIFGNRYDPHYIGSRNGSTLSQIGYMFSSVRAVTELFGGHALPFYLKLENPTFLKALDQSYTAKEAIKGGADAIVWRGVKDGGALTSDIYLMARGSESQIKSADPFTGVPLSQRFNPASNDIRYSRPAKGTPSLEQSLENALNSTMEDDRSEFEGKPVFRGKMNILNYVEEMRNRGVMTKEAADLVTSFIDKITPAALADTAFRIRAGHSDSRYNFAYDVATLFTGSDDPAVSSIHEFWHGLTRYLPNTEVTKIREDYKRALARHIAKNPEFKHFVGKYSLTPKEYAALGKSVSPDVDAQLTAVRNRNNDIVRYNIDFTKENYRFVSLDEWVAEKMTEIAMGKLESPNTVLGKLAKILKDFFALIQSKLGLNAYEKFFNSVISRKARIEAYRRTPLEFMEDSAFERFSKADRMKLTGAARVWVNAADAGKWYDDLTSPARVSTLMIEDFKSVGKKMPALSDVSSYVQRTLDDPNNEGNPHIIELKEQYGDNRAKIEHDFLEEMRGIHSAAQKAAYDYLYNGYSHSPAFRSLMLRAFLYGQDRTTLGAPPAVSGAALADTFAAVEAGQLVSVPAIARFYRLKAAEAAEAMAARANAGIEGLDGGKWVELPKVPEDATPEQTQDIYAMWQGLSDTNWCTSRGMEKTYAHAGPMWVFRKNNASLLAIRFDSDEVAEIQSPKNDGTIPPEHVAEVKNFSKNAKLGSTARGTIAKAEMQAEILAMIEEKRAPGQPWENAGSYSYVTLTDGTIALKGDYIGFSAQFLSNISIITGNFDARKNIPAPALTTVGGDTIIEEGTSVPSLTTVGGDVILRENASAPTLTTTGGSTVLGKDASAPSLTTVGGYFNFNRANVNSISKLKSVGGGFFVTSFQNITFDSLERVGEHLEYDMSGNISFPSLERVGTLDIRENANMPVLRVVEHTAYVTGASLPSLLVVGERLQMHGNARVPELTSVGGSFSISNAGSETPYFPKLVAVGEEAETREGKVVRSVKNTNIGREAALKGTPLDPNNDIIGEGLAASTSTDASDYLEDFPDGFTVENVIARIEQWESTEGTGLPGSKGDATRARLSRSYDPTMVMQTVDFERMSNRKTVAEWNEMGAKLLNAMGADRIMAYVAAQGAQNKMLNPMVTKAAIFAMDQFQRKMMSHPSQRTPKNYAKLAAFSLGFRATGTAASSSLAARKDNFMTPEERSVALLIDASMAVSTHEQAKIDKMVESLRSREASKGTPQHVIDRKAMELVVKHSSVVMERQRNLTEQMLEKNKLSLHDILYADYEIVHGSDLYEEMVKSFSSDEKAALDLMVDGTRTFREIAKALGIPLRKVLDARVRFERAVKSHVSSAGTIYDPESFVRSGSVGEKTDDATSGDILLKAVMGHMGFVRVEKQGKAVNTEYDTRASGFAASSKVSLSSADKQAQHVLNSISRRGKVKVSASNAVKDRITDYLKKRSPASADVTALQNDLVKLGVTPKLASSLAQAALNVIPKRVMSFVDKRSAEQAVIMARKIQISSQGFRGWSMLNELAYANMFSAVATHSGNIMGNTASILVQKGPVRFVDGVISGVLRVLSKIPGMSGLDPKERGAYLRELVMILKESPFGAAEGMRYAGIMARTGIDMFGWEDNPASFKANLSPQDLAEMSMVYGVNLPAIVGWLETNTGNKVKDMSRKGANWIINIGGKVIRIPLRALAVEDALFKQMNARVEVRGQALRIAKGREKLKGAALQARIDELTSNPQSEAWVRARRIAVEEAFQTKYNENFWLERGIAHMDSWLRKPVDSFFGSLAQFVVRMAFFPVMKTGYNLGKAAFRLSPIGAIPLALKTTTALKKAFSSEDESTFFDNAPEFTHRLAEVLVGSAMWAVVAAIRGSEGDDDDLDKNFLIVGSPFPGQRDRGENLVRQKRFGGSFFIQHREASIHNFSEAMKFAFNRFVLMDKDAKGDFTGPTNRTTFAKFEPLATALLLAVDGNRVLKMDNLEMKEKVMIMTQFIEAQMADKSFARGFGDIVRLRRGESSANLHSFAVNFLSSIFVPNMLKAWQRANDPYLRNYATTTDEARFFPSAENNADNAKLNYANTPVLKDTSFWQEIITGRRLEYQENPQNPIPNNIKALSRWNNRNYGRKEPGTEKDVTYGPPVLEYVRTIKLPGGSAIKVDLRKYPEIYQGSVREYNRVFAAPSNNVSRREADNPSQSTVLRIKDVSERASKQSSMWVERQIRANLPKFTAEK